MVSLITGRTAGTGAPDRYGSTGRTAGTGAPDRYGSTGRTAGTGAPDRYGSTGRTAGTVCLFLIYFHWLATGTASITHSHSGAGIEEQGV